MTPTTTSIWCSIHVSTPNHPPIASPAASGMRNSIVYFTPAPDARNAMSITASMDMANDT